MNSKFVSTLASTPASKTNLSFPVHIYNLISYVYYLLKPAKEVWLMEVYELIFKI